MSDLELINQIIEAHHSIGENVELVATSVNDLEVVLTLQKERSGWDTDSEEAFSKKKQTLERTMASLEKGLKAHFAFEEQLLPRLLGEYLMQAIRLDHDEIAKEIDEARTMLTSLRLETDYNRLLSQKWQARQSIDHVCQIVEEHAHAEHILLKMVKSTLVNKSHLIESVPGG